MKYDLFGQIKSYLESKGLFGMDNNSDFIYYLNSSNIPELKGLRVDKNSEFKNTRVPLVSSFGEKFELFNDWGNVTIVSKDTHFAVSTSEKRHFLQCGIENDVIKADLSGSRLFVEIYTDVLENGKLVDDLSKLVSDTVQSINMEFIDSQGDKDRGKRILIIKDSEKKVEIEVPIHMSIINIMRLVSNAIRENYRKNIGVEEVQRIGK